jgi:GPH family glycoside/pentoside/hexuronide:cation symporter
LHKKDNNIDIANDRNENIPTERISTMFSFGMGDFIYEVFNGIFGAFFFLYWETEVKLDIWIVTLAYVIFAIWNSANDPLIGYLTDRPNRFWKKYGKRFPMVMIGTVPAILTLAAIFSSPFLDPVQGAWIYFAWILITTCSYELFFTLSSLNHYALYPEKFKTDRQRRRAGGIRMALALVGTAIGFIVPPLLIEYENRASYTNMVWIFVIFNLIFFLSLIPGHRESNYLKKRYMKEKEEQKEQISFWDSIRIVLRHKNFLVVILIFFLDSIIGVSLTASVQYVAKYVLEAEAETSIYILAGFILGALISLGPWLFFSEKINDNRRMLIIGVFLNTIFLLPFMFANDLFWLVIAAVLLGIGGGALRIGRNPVMADAIDEATLNSKRHLEGAFMGVYTFFNRFALIAQGIIFAVVHELTGFNANLPNQTELAKFGIRLHTALIPMILTLIGLIIFFRVYDLFPEKTAKIKQKLKELKL